jgi:hypothetical protein
MVGISLAACSIAASIGKDRIISCGIFSNGYKPWQPTTPNDFGTALSVTFPIPHEPPDVG